MTTLRYSLKRSAILENLQGRHDHPSADIIYQDMKKIMPSISLGTVYRNLQTLCDTHQIHKINTDDQVVHYDANLSNHHHFICRECKSIIDVDVVSLDSISLEHNVESMDVVYYGICKECKNNMRR